MPTAVIVYSNEMPELIRTLACRLLHLKQCAKRYPDQSQKFVDEINKLTTSIAKTVDQTKQKIQYWLSEINPLINGQVHTTVGDTCLSELPETVTELYLLKLQLEIAATTCPAIHSEKERLEVAIKNAKSDSVAATRQIFEEIYLKKIPA